MQEKRREEKRREEKRREEKSLNCPVPLSSTAKHNCLITGKFPFVPGPRPRFCFLFFFMISFVIFTAQARAHFLRGRPATVEDGINEDDEGYTWLLPSYPFSFFCYRDRDCDGFYDWAEADLAWAFRPYLVYDADEDLSKGSLILYQATPISHTPHKTRIQLSWVFLFRADRTHHGDSEKITSVVESTDPDRQLWQLVYVKFKNCKISTGLPGCSGSTMHSEWNIDKGRDHAGIKWQYSNKTGMIHHRVHVSKKKHGMWASKKQCECCYHGGMIEKCNGGWEGLPLLGVSLRDHAETGSGGEGWDAAAVVAEYQELTHYQKKYSGNIGEIYDYSPTTAGVSPDPRFIFFPSLGSGSLGYLGESAIYPTTTDAGVFKWGIWSGYEDAWGGTWKGWDHGFQDEWIWDMENDCFCGGKGREHGECCAKAGNSTTWCSSCHGSSCTYCADGVKYKLTVSDFSTMTPPGWTLEDMMDEDGDGIPKMFDCDDLNPILGIDADMDSFCDEPVPDYLHLKCTAYCNRHHVEPRKQHCIEQCTTDVPDNCIDHTDPACTELVEDLKNGALDVINLAKYNECYEKYFNRQTGLDGVMFQPDTSGDGVGDKCAGRTMAGFTSVHVWEHEETSMETVEGPGGISYRVMKTCPVSRIFIGLDAYLGTMGEITKPVVVEGCDCKPELTAEDCELEKCFNDHKHDYDMQSDSFSFRWIPTNGCWGKKEEFLKARAQAGDFSEWTPGCSQGDRCRYKDAKFSYPEPSRFSSGWNWVEHTRFQPPTLEESLCKYEPDPESDHISLQNRNTRLRATYPEPQPGDDMNSDSWYASNSKYTVWQGYITANQLEVPDQSECTNTYLWELFQGVGMVVQDIYKEPAPIGPGPLIYQVVTDPLSAEIAVIGIKGDVLQPVSFKPVTKIGADLPPIEELAGAVWTAAAMDTAIAGTGDEVEVVTVAYMNVTSEAGPAPEPADRGELLLGFVEQPDNAWFYWSDLFGDVEIPALENPQLIYHKQGNRLLLVGDRAFDDERGMQQNVVYTLSLDDGSVRESAPLHWLDGLSNYSVATDGINEKAYIVGGTRFGDGGGYAAPGEEESVFEVWSYDLRNNGFRLMADSGAGPAGRKGAALAVDGVRGKLFIYGGKNAEGESLNDLWEINLFTRNVKLVHEGDGESSGEKPLMTFDRMNQRLWLLEDTDAEMELKAHALDIQDPRWVEQTVYSFEDDAEPGVSKGQIRFGRPETVSYTVPESVSYGALFAAELVSEEPNLKLELRDSNGKRLNESRVIDAGALPLVTWPVIPGETYQLVVSPERNASQEEHPYFELRIREAAQTEEFTYMTSWKVRDMEISGDTTYLACKEGIEAVDVSDEGNMTLIAIHDEVKKTMSISAIGRWLAVGRGPGLWSLVVMDGREPENLQLVSGVKALGMGRDLATVGRTVYAAHGLFGVKIYNLDNPGNAFLASTFQAGGPVLTVDEGKGKLYAGHMKLGLWKKRGVDIYDISEDPGSVPEKVGEVETAGTPVFMRVLGNKLLVAVMHKTSKVMKCFAGVSCMEPDGVEVYDITIADSPELVAVLEYEQTAGLFGKYSGTRVVTVKETGFRVIREVME